MPSFFTTRVAPACATLIPDASMIVGAYADCICCARPPWATWPRAVAKQAAASNAATDRPWFLLEVCILNFASQTCMRRISGEMLTEFAKDSLPSRARAVYTDRKCLAIKKQHWA